MSAAAKLWPRALKTMKEVFQLDGFRPGQDEVIRSVLDRRNTLAVMPTGAGKSLCYQLPALLLPGTTVVVSPLIALMNDQVGKLHDLGVDARQVNSALSAAEAREAIARIKGKRSEFVLTTPERLAAPEFMATLTRNRIDLFVIDEAHCISQWGHDFRPAYLQLRAARAALGRPPVLALTATATEAVIKDIAEQLDIDDFTVVNTGVFRPNLHYEVRMCEGDDTRQMQLTQLLDQQEGPGIIYVPTIKHAAAVNESLRPRFGDRVALYHGRMAATARRESQARFMNGDLAVIVATNAFGMGIDKADIRYVIHYGMPGSLEAYYQESGRAGRDGLPARCALLYERQDKRVQLFFMGGRYPAEKDVTTVVETLARRAPGGEPLSMAELRAAGTSVPKLRVVLSLLKDAGVVRERRGARFELAGPGVGDDVVRGVTLSYRERGEADRARLDQMIIYAQTALCRWKVLLEYFGETTAAERCGRCDNCGRAIEREMASEPALHSAAR